MEPALEDLGRDVCLHVMRELPAHSLLSLGSCSKEWSELIAEDSLWENLCRREQPAMARQHTLSRAAGRSWRETYERAHRMQAMRTVRWQQELAAGRNPRRREGHAACSWGRRSMLLQGGFGGGILSDLHILTPASYSSPAGSPASSEAARSAEAPVTRSAAAAAAAGSSSGGGADVGPSHAGSSAAAGYPAAAGGPAYRWVQPEVAGRPPVRRYGHTLSRCGRRGELAVVFGGLMAGGYQAPLDTIAVLRRKPPPGSPAADAGKDEDGEERREEHTSLGRRQVMGALGGGAGQPPGPDMAWAFDDILWAQAMLGAEWEGGEEEEDSEEEEEEGSDEDEEDSEEDSEEAEEGGSAASSSGSEEEGVEQMRAGPASLAAAPPAPASGSQHTSSQRGSGQQQGQQHWWEAAEAQQAGSGRQQAGEEEQEEEDFAGLQYEWFYPRVKGEPPAARGYHSAAVSPDGCKVYFLGGLTSSGPCSTLAVLDVTSWTFSVPLTTGDPPPGRMGHSSCVYANRLWVVGGGTGQDLLRSGRDLRDAYCLDLDSWEWRRVPLPVRASPACTGKCHSGVLLGSRLLLFGGSMPTCSDLAWLDLESLSWGGPERVAGQLPEQRMSATAVLAGEEVLVFGGYSLYERELGDLQRLRLLPSREELEAEERRAAGGGRFSAAASRRWASQALRSLWM